jgi:UDP-N-acetylglucosamine 1-carboxyvinyltransferase
LHKIVIKGGAKLRGEISVSGAKNAALPIFASSLLATGTSVYRNVPDLGDVRSMQRLLVELGATARGRGDTVEIDTSGLAGAAHFRVGYDLVSTMRASILARGPSTSTSPGSRRWGRRSASSRVTSSRGRGGCAGRGSCSTWSP